MTLRATVCFLAAALAGWAQAGQTGYLARCAGCHGEDGSGGGHGPGFVQLAAPRVTARAQLSDILRHGIPGTAMPAFALPPAELEAIADYTWSLKTAAPATPAATTGDAAKGEREFNARCARCHMVRGRGGVLGPDLTTVGRDRTPAQLSAALRGGPGSSLTVTLHDGRILRGIARNRSPFDLQLLAVEGTLHLLRSEQIRSAVAGPSFMEPVRGDTSHLLAYLAMLREPVGIAAGATLGPGIPFADIVRPRPGEWPTYNGLLSGNRFSPLTQIRPANVSKLAPQWMFPIPGAPGSLQTTPLVVDGVMYVSSVNEVYALDAGTGRTIWHFERPRTKGLAGDAASGINRGVAILGDRVFLATDHAHLLALHRATGHVLWEVEMADYRENYGATGAPLVVNDLVIAGISGGDEGVRGFLDAYRAATGERVWRFWTIPARGDKEAATWKGNALDHGCGTTWLTGTYDPETRLLYWPTGNPCPDYNGDERVGDNLYTDSVVALDPTTGKLRWHYQFTPHDLHDWDATEPPVLADLDGRKLLVQANRNGFFYTLDRVTGRLLRAQPFVRQLTWASGIGADGRPVLLPGNEPAAGGQRTCPSVAGAANWTSTALDERSGLYYFFAHESCTIYSKRTEPWQAGQSFYGGTTRRSAADGGEKILKAMDLRTGKVAWEIPNIGGSILGSGVLATAASLVFYGDGRGAFVAADAASGKLLWHFNTGANWRAGPMTYTVGGRQWIAVAAGNTILAFGLPRE
jgi:alcohol dehydrogenase (cytochrome c)